MKKETIDKAIQAIRDVIVELEDSTSLPLEFPMIIASDIDYLLEALDEAEIRLGYMQDVWGED